MHFGILAQHPICCEHDISLSVTAEYDHTVQQKVEMGTQQDRTAFWIPARRSWPRM